MTNARLVAVAYFVIAVLGGLFLEAVLRLIWGYGGWTDPQLVGEGWTLTTLIAFVVAFGTAVGVAMNTGMREVSLEVISELRKVTWPTWIETRAATIAVIIVSFVVAAILGTFDFAWASVTKIIYEGGKFAG